MTAARFAGVDELLADARSRLRRVDPETAYELARSGCGLVDIRPEGQRAAEGGIPGAHLIERNHLEWRLDPNSGAAIPEAAPGRRWVVFCSEGYTSSLAADSLNSIGVPATDIVGGFAAWRAAGLPTEGG